MDIIDYIRKEKRDRECQTYWMDQNENTIKISRLEDSHLMNIPRFLYKKYCKRYTINQIKNMIPTEIYKELEFRGMKILYEDNFRVVKKRNIRRGRR